jgi:hypothetical protein
MYYNMDEPKENYAKWNKPGIKRHTLLCDSTYMTKSSSQNPWNRK